MTGYTPIRFERNIPPGEIANEVLRVGIIPAKTHMAGDRLRIGDHDAEITEEVSPEVFLDRIKAAGLPLAPFTQCPPEFRFYRFRLLNTD